jgi:hypothetical protein
LLVAWPFIAVADAADAEDATEAVAEAEEEEEAEVGPLRVGWASLATAGAACSMASMMASVSGSAW